jgi:acyl dehydratase
LFSDNWYAWRTDQILTKGLAMAQTIINGLDGVRAALNTEFAVSDWLTITQEQINLFAQATHDHQWIHVDIERAKAGPFGAPIAHGFLTLSLIAGLAESAFTIHGEKMAVNYGLNKVRFTAPVRVNSRLRARFKLIEIKELAKGGVQMVSQVTLEIDGQERPACVADSVRNSYY